MNIFKRFIGEPTVAEKAAALAFKNKLKYGDDINARYKDACEKSLEAYKEQGRVKDKLEEIFKYEERTIYQDWTSFRISGYENCTESPIGQCLYISHYGDKSPEKDDPIYCMCCKKKLF